MQLHFHGKQERKRTLNQKRTLFQVHLFIEDFQGTENLIIL